MLQKNKREQIVDNEVQHKRQGIFTLRRLGGTHKEVAPNLNSPYLPNKNKNKAPSSTNFTMLVLVRNVVDDNRVYPKAKEPRKTK